MVAQTMNLAPRPPLPSAHEATQRALQRDNTEELSTQDTWAPENSARADSFVGGFVQDQQLSLQGMCVCKKRYIVVFMTKSVRGYTSSYISSTTGAPSHSFYCKMRLVKHQHLLFHSGRFSPPLSIHIG